MLRIKSDRIITDERLFDGYIYIENEKIADISREERPADECYDFTGRYVSPGFIETHTHGAVGCDFYLTSPEEIASACNYHLRHGATTILPTILACPHEHTKATIEAFLAAKAQNLILSNAPGVHIEGPYLNAAQCGGQPPQYITPPIEKDYIEIIEKYPDAVKRWTYAPEFDTEGKFCRYITERGIIASAGHSNAKYDDMCRAIESGCNLVTHLYSCTSTVTRDHGFRSLGVIESTYLRDELWAEMIADGKHLPPELICMIVKLKGTDRLIVTTDSCALTGNEEIKNHSVSASSYIIEDGVAKLPDRSAFAGSIATCDRLIRVLTKECGIDLLESVKMLTKNPAKLLHLNTGIIAAGYDADIIVFDEDINISDIFVRGNKTNL